MSDCLLRGRSARGRGQSAIYLKTVCPVLSGYSGQSSGYSGPGFFYFILFCLLGPTTVKYLTLSHSQFTLSLSPSLPSLPLPLTPSPWPPSPSQALPLPKSQTPNPPPRIDPQDQRDFESAWRTIFPTYSFPGCPRFQVLRTEKSAFKVRQLVPPRSMFLGGSK